MTPLRSALPLVGLLLGALFVSPLAGAHAAEEPVAVEIEVLADEGEDAFYWYDGYDLFNLFVREAYWEPLDQEGVIFRFTLYGGFAPVPTADALHIDIGPEDGQMLRLSTTNDQNWTGDLVVVAQDIVADEPPFTGYTAKLQAFASYEALGVARGQTLGPLRMASYAGGDLVDVAPGGFFLPGSGGQAEVPAESTRLVDAIDLVGPTGYVTWRAAAADALLTIAVQNVFEATGQHVKVVPVATPGWDVLVEGPSQASIDGGRTATFTLNLTAAPTVADPLPIALVSDLGGREWLYVGVNGTTYEVAGTPDGVSVSPDAPPAESPGAGALVTLLVAALVATVAVRRR